MFRMILGGWLVVSVAGGGLASDAGRTGEGNLLNVDTRPLTERHRRTVDPVRRLRLAKDGVAVADIIIPEMCSPVVVFAAQELKRHLDRATGGDFTILRSRSFRGSPQPVRTRAAIFLGDDPWSRALSGVNLGTLPRDAYVIKSANGAVVIAGRDDPFASPAEALERPDDYAHRYERGTLNGVYDFLETGVGVRIFFPIDELTVIPDAPDLDVPFLDVEESPDFFERTAHWSSEFTREGQIAHQDYWPTREAMIRTRSLQSLVGRAESVRRPNMHGLQALGLIPRFAETHPEFFAMRKDGTRASDVRRPEGQAGSHPAHLCYSNTALEDEIVKDVRSFLSGESATVRDIRNRYSVDHGAPVRWNETAFAFYPGYFSIMPSDGMIKCHCPDCAPFTEFGRDSDLVFGFAARVGRRMKEAGIHGRLTAMAYTFFQRVPDCELPDNMDFMVADLGPWNERNLSEAERVGPDRLLLDWSRKLGGRKVALWNYMISDFGMTPVGVPPMSPRDVAAYYRRNAGVVDGVFLQSAIWNMLHGYLNMYMFHKIAWDTSLDPEAILADHHRSLFGPAAEPMAAFYDRLEQLWVERGLPRIMETALGPVAVKRSPYEVWERAYDAAALKALDVLLRDAENRASEEAACLARVAFIRKHFFETILLARERHMALKQDLDDVALHVPVEGASIRIDGDLAEAEWGGAATAWLHPVGREPDIPQTRVVVRSDGRMLYLGFHCPEPRTSAMRLAAGSEVAAAVWNDACIEVFIKPDMDRTRTDYYHLGVNAAGVVEDVHHLAKGRDDASWRSEARVVSRIIPGRAYVVELAIPFESLNMPPPGPGDEILFNLARARFFDPADPAVASPYSSWSPHLRFGEGLDGFHDIERFGVLRFTEARRESKGGVRNGSFEGGVKPHPLGEVPEGWGAWWVPDNEAGRRPLIAVVDNTSREGGRALMIRNEALLQSTHPSGVRITVDQVLDHEPLLPNTTYRLTYFIKTEAIAPLARDFTRGAFAYLDLGAGGRRFLPAEGFTGSIPWTKQGFTFTTADRVGGTHDAPVPHLWLSLWNTRGTVWFDAIKLEPVQGDPIADEPR